MKPYCHLQCSLLWLTLELLWKFVRYAGVVLSKGSANRRWYYKVTFSLIGWSHTQNDPWMCAVIFLFWMMLSGEKSSLKWSLTIETWTVISLTLWSSLCLLMAWHCWVIRHQQAQWWLKLTPYSLSVKCWSIPVSYRYRPKLNPLKTGSYFLKVILFSNIVQVWYFYMKPVQYNEFLASIVDTDALVL